jgi:hypothetical protein
MTDAFIDDVTGDVERDVGKQVTFGIYVLGQVEAFHTSTETLGDDPEAVADEMHALVDDWLAAYRATADGEEVVVDD